MIEFKFLLVALASASVVQAQPKTHIVTSLNRPIKLMVGDTAIHQSSGMSVTLKSFIRHVSKCAVPGKNCGAGYHPNPITMPELTIVHDQKKCETDQKLKPLSKICEAVQHVVDTDNSTYVNLEFTDIFAPCEKLDQASKESCYSSVTIGFADSTPLHPDNCNRISEVDQRDRCFERVADKLQDPAICDKIKGQEGFQCVLLRATRAKDPGLCRTLKKGPFHHSEADLNDQIASCVDAVSRLVPKH